MFFRKNCVYFQRISRPVFKFMKQKMSINGILADVKNDLNNLEENIKKLITFLPDPIKPSTDKKDYKVIRLKNGLTATLISDLTPIPQEGDEACAFDEQDEGSDEEEEGEEAMSESDSEDESSFPVNYGRFQKMAAVGLSVGVGSFSDPPNIPGMAHFVEHMVFMGSEKYPKENDFDSYLAKRAGSSNACTDFNHTVFYFQSQEKFLEESIQRFASFFEAPLMRREAMTREREAIDSEFEINMACDSNRLEQLLQSLTVADHPPNRFSWGNLISLRDNVSDDELYEEAHKFHRRHYSAHRMNLAIQARVPLAVLATWVVKYFSDIPNNGLPPDDFSPYYGAISFQTPEFTKLYRVKSVKQVYEVNITCAFPSVLDKYKVKPHRYISSILGYEGTNSLMSYYKQKVWVLCIEAGNEESDFYINEMYSLGSLTLTLTEEGMSHFPEVMEALFGYIKLMQQSGPVERIFEEQKQIADTAFHFSDEIPSVEFVESVSESMLFHPSSDYLTGPDLYFLYDPEEIKKCMDYLTPERVNIMILSKDGDFDKEEPWFGTQYSVEDIPAEWLKMWKDAKPLPCFQLPCTNQFLTTDFSIIPIPENVPPYPISVRKDNLCEIWYRRDVKFLQPRAIYSFYFISPLARSSLQNCVLLDLYCNLLLYCVAEEAYPAIIAELTYVILPGIRGIEICLSGFNQKLRLLLGTILRHMKNFVNEVNEAAFNAVKEDRKKHCFNSFLKPFELVTDLRFSILISGHWTAVEKHSAYSDITFEMMQDFARKFLEHLYVQSLVQGNVSMEDALNASSDIINVLQYQPLMPNTAPEVRIYKVPNGALCYRAMSFNTEDSSTYVVNYYQNGAGTIRDSCIIEFLMMIMEEPLFNTLRTQEKLGYDVSCRLRDTYGILGFSIKVNTHADKYSADHVDERIETFIASYLELLKSVPAEEIELVRHALIQSKECVDVYLKEEVTRNWSEIVSNCYIFDRLEKEVEAIKQITQQELIEWLENHISCGNLSNYRKLSIQVVGHVRDAEEEKLEEQGTPVRSSKLVKHHAGSSRATKKRCVSPEVTTGLRNSGNVNLQLITKSEGYFINDIHSLRQNLYLYPVNLITS